LCYSIGAVWSTATKAPDLQQTRFKEDGACQCFKNQPFINHAPYAPSIYNICIGIVCLFMYRGYYTHMHVHTHARG
jgi:hypothetical protein